uniref:RNase III domain-containing protein n=1 Tax=Glycine max TaxID=3847 RepID=A0A0R0LJU4_SOYBN
MELSSSFLFSPKPCSCPPPNYSLSPLIRNRNPNFRIVAVALEPQQQQDFPSGNSPQRLLKELAERKKATSPKKGPPRRFILRPPIDDNKLAERFLNSPQLCLKLFPLLSSCLPSSRLNNADKLWIDEYLLEAKQALGYSLEPSETLGDDNPAKQFDTLLYLAFQHPSCERTKARHVRSGHSRLSFLGQYVLELALTEFFLQRYPRESPGPMRERVFGLIGKRSLPKWIKAASLHNLIFTFDDMDKIMRREKEGPVKSVFWALFGAIYLCFGMPEVYRVLFEVFGMDPDAEDCQPKLRRQLEDVDYVSAEFEGKLSWQDIVAYKMLCLNTQGYSELVFPQECIGLGAIYGITIQDPML